MLDVQFQQQLLSRAHEAVSSHPEPLPPLVHDGLSAELLQPAGAFVTWTKFGDLRGCVGRMAAELPLYQTVGEVAVMAAYEDPRFPPVEGAEITHLRAEISVLTPMESITGAEDIVIGRDGLFLVSGRNSGLLLPQVAEEEGFDADEFLRATCIKAGLPPEGWPGDAQLFRFSTVIFADAGQDR